jgi:hypothetical protein
VAESRVNEDEASDPSVACTETIVDVVVTVDVRIEAVTGA